MNEEFEKFYQKIEKDIDTEIQNVNKKNVYLWLTIIWGICTFLFYPKYHYDRLYDVYSGFEKIIYHFYEELFPLGAIIYILSVIFFVLNFMKLLKYDDKLNNYYFKFKEKVIKKMLLFFGDKLEYFYNQEISKEDYLKGDFLNTTNYSSSDLIKGMIDNNYIEISKVKAYTNFSGSSINDFKGIFVKINLSKKIKTDIYFKRKKEKLKKSSLVKIKNEELNKIFNIYTTDKNLVLTEDMTDLLLKFHQDINKDYELIIKENNLFIRIFYPDWFSLNLIKNGSLDKEKLYNYYQTLNFIFAFLKKLLKRLI